MWMMKFVIVRADTEVCPYGWMWTTLARDSPPLEGRGRFPPPLREGLGGGSFIYLCVMISRIMRSVWHMASAPMLVRL